MRNRNFEPARVKETLRAMIKRLDTLSLRDNKAMIVAHLDTAREALKSAQDVMTLHQRELPN